MKVTVNYPEANSIGEKQFLENIALYKAILIKEKINSMNISSESKRKLINEMLLTLKNNEKELF